MKQLTWISHHKERLGKCLALVTMIMVSCLTLIQIVHVVQEDHAPTHTNVAVLMPEKPVVQFDALFGPYEGKDRPLQETGLNLQLTAVFAMQDPVKGSAVISTSGRKALLQIVGDQLPGGVVLKEVHEDYVVLEQAGQQSVLRLPKKSL